MSQLDDWIESGKHLPPPMRDFHDAKDLFKSIHEIISVEKHEYAKDISWVMGHCYVIDIFLWFMARRGYTLQRSRNRLEFRDLEADISEATNRRRDAFFDAIKNRNGVNP